MHWSIFIYNYGWEKYIKFINGWIPKFALFIPIIGYLILFNDPINKMLTFNNLANEEVLNWGLTAIDRLRIIYFALLLLGLSNFLYYIFKPYIFKFGTTQQDYVSTCLEIFTLHDFINLHSSIREEGHYTQYGKYYDSEWNGFLESSHNQGEGTKKIDRTGDWEGSKLKYGSLLRSILLENFFKQNIKNRFWLTTCIALTTIGYFLLSIPSIDLFIKVILTII